MIRDSLPARACFFFVRSRHFSFPKDHARNMYVDLPWSFSLLQGTVAAAFGDGCIGSAVTKGRASTIDGRSVFAWSFCASVPCSLSIWTK
jgi:hypothetical protein